MERVKYGKLKYMIIKSVASYMGGHEVFELRSQNNIYKMGTFCLQMPAQINSNVFFEIPDEFMQKELNLIQTVNPLKWYMDEKEKVKDNAPESNFLFEKFMDSIAKFCNYDRKGKMEERQRWYESTQM